jgi:hypothetical protein
VALPFPAASARQLATSVLPRLALYGTLPPSLVPQLLPVLASDDRRAARLAAYLLQVQLGCGSGGTPTLPPTRGQLLLCPIYERLCCPYYSATPAGVARQRPASAQAASSTLSNVVC